MLRKNKTKTRRLKKNYQVETKYKFYAHITTAKEWCSSWWCDCENQAGAEARREPAAVPGRRVVESVNANRGPRFEATPTMKNKCLVLASPPKPKLPWPSYLAPGTGRSSGLAVPAAAAQAEGRALEWAGPGRRPAFRPDPGSKQVSEEAKSPAFPGRFRPR